MYCFREPIRGAVSRFRLDWRLKFIVFATLLALTEEAITTTMTNLAPLFGVKVGEAYITASTNYLDVVALHSVVMFVPFLFILIVPLPLLAGLLFPHHPKIHFPPIGH